MDVLYFAWVLNYCEIKLVRIVSEIAEQEKFSIDTSNIQEMLNNNRKLIKS